MHARTSVKVHRMDPRSAVSISNVIKKLIGNLGYYNDQAQHDEIAKYVPGRLREMHTEDRDSVLVADIRDRIAGFCISKYDDGLIWLAWFGVVEECRGAGVGTALLKALENTVQNRKCHKIWCDTRTSNKQSQQLLRKVGYRRIGRLTRHWYGQDFFLWEKFIE